MHLRLPLVITCCLHVASVHGFSLPTSRFRQHSIVLFSVNGNEESESRGIEEVTSTKSDDVATSTNLGGCDLGAEFERDLEEGYARRNAQAGQSQPNFFQAMINVVLDLGFVRRNNPERQRKLFLTKRYYARNETFAKKILSTPPVVEDLLPYPTPIDESFFLSVPAAILTFVISSAVFPFMADFMVDFIDIPPQNLEKISSKLIPGVSILYGTFVSLTLSILYNRQRQVQDSVAQETSMLSFLLHNLVSLFRRDRSRMVRAGQCAADQVRILLRENRGIEFMSLIYIDPYIRMLKLVEEEEERLMKEHGSFLSKGPTLSLCRDIIKDLRKIRASRLSDESLFLPGTHYFILKALTFLLLLGYFISVLPSVDELGYVPFESTILFGTLCTVYLLFYAFAIDLNDLYNGVFQIRRGSSASHLLEIKKIVADHPWLRFEVSFERVNREILCFYPGLADVWFDNEQNVQPGQLR